MKTVEAVYVEAARLHWNSGDIGRLISCKEICEKSIIKGYFVHYGKMFAATGAVASREGYGLIFGNEIVPIDQWQGEVLTYHERAMMHLEDLQADIGPFYRGVKVRCKKEWFVFTGYEVEFWPFGQMVK